MATQEQKKRFVQQYYQDAVNGGGGPALGILAQAALESGWGNSAPGNMLFGVKAGPSWKGKRQLLRTWEAGSTSQPPSFQAGEYLLEKFAPGATGNPWKTRWAFRCMVWFRAYSKPVESFQDHAKLLAGKRYENAAGVTVPEVWAEKVAQAGYATAPGYSSSLKAVIGEIRGMIKGLALEQKQAGGGMAIPLLVTGVVGIGITILVLARKKKKKAKAGMVIPFQPSIINPKRKAA